MGKNISTGDLARGKILGRLAFYTWVYFSSVVYFSQRRSVWIKKIILQKLTGAAKYPRLDRFSDPVSHFGLCRYCSVADSERMPPVIYFSHRRNPLIKFYLTKVDGSTQKLRGNPLSGTNLIFWI